MKLQHPLWKPFKKFIRVELGYVFESIPTSQLMEFWHTYLKGAEIGIEMMAIDTRSQPIDIGESSYKTPKELR